MVRKIKLLIINLPALAAIGVIKFYQNFLSPDHSWLKSRFPHGYCRFYPSCSEYSKQSLERFGFIRGVWLSAKRVIRCHPWAQPKVDPVPQHL